MLSESFGLGPVLAFDRGDKFMRSRLYLVKDALELSKSLTTFLNSQSLRALLCTKCD